MNRVSNNMHADRRLFLRILAQRLCDSGSFCLTYLQFGDRPVAWNYGFRFLDSWFWYQPTFEPSLEEYAPGTVLLANMVMEACEHPQLKMIDLGLGAEGYKERFANTTRTTLHVTASHSSVSTVRAAVRYRVSETVKRSPRLEATIRKNLAHLTSVRNRIESDGPGKFVGWASNSAARRLISSVEVRFYQWLGGERHTSSQKGSLQKMSLDDLAEIAMAHQSDAETVAYLLRASQRLRRNDAEGFLLLSPQRRAVHLCWAADFAGFRADELKTTLLAPSPDATLIFDCWTPRAERGEGYYGVAITALAALLHQRGRKPWIFAAAINTPSILGIERAGFAYQFSMVSKRAGFSRKLTIMSQSPKPAFQPAHS